MTANKQYFQGRLLLLVHLLISIIDSSTEANTFSIGFEYENNMFHQETDLKSVLTRAHLQEILTRKSVHSTLNTANQLFLVFLIVRIILSHKGRVE